jgi:hypothetical protein
MPLLPINEFNFYPGVYQHYRGDLYIAFDIINYMDGPDGKMAKLSDPLVCYRDLHPIVKHVDGKPQQAAHQQYARPLSEFTGFVSYNGEKVKRFTLQ